MKYGLFLLLIFVSSFAFATSDAVVEDPFAELAVDKSMAYYRSLGPAEAYKRAQAVFNYFKVPEESSNEDYLIPFQGASTLSAMTATLKLMGIEKEFPRFTKVENDTLKIFKDRDGLTEEDFTFDFGPEKRSIYVPEAIKNLENARNNPPSRPLKGLKVAIDPGHMSTQEWVKRTGKFVRAKNGVTLSEGLLTLQTSLVLKAELEKLGATVMLTREDHEPISKTPYGSLDLTKFAREALREHSLEDWFQALLTTAPAGPLLYRAVEKHPKVQALFKESARANYFILREDLLARVNVINEFAPDISLVIHYDSVDPANDPNGVGTRHYSKVKTYVHGAIAPEEWATQEDRRFILMHALDTASYKSSFELSQTVVNSMSQGLGLVHDVSGGGNSHLVAPGVFVRNLYITRKMQAHAHTYIECLHYNDPTEFKALQRKDFELTIDGQTTYYSSRLQQVAFAIRDGVVSFVSKNK